MIVGGGNECADADGAVGARAVLDNDGLAPLLGELVGEHAAGHVDAGAGRLGRDDLDGARRPLRLRMGRDASCAQQNGGCEKTACESGH